MSVEILKLDHFGKLFQLVVSTTQSPKMFFKTEKLPRVHDASYGTLMYISSINHSLESLITEKGFLWIAGFAKGQMPRSIVLS